jgi:hypothetical protein
MDTQYDSDLKEKIRIQHSEPPAKLEQKDYQKQYHSYQQRLYQKQQFIPLHPLDY